MVEEFSQERECAPTYTPTTPPLPTLLSPKSPNGSPSTPAPTPTHLLSPFPLPLLVTPSRHEQRVPPSSPFPPSSPVVPPVLPSGSAGAPLRRSLRLSTATALITAPPPPTSTPSSSQPSQAPLTHRAGRVYGNPSSTHPHPPPPTLFSPLPAVSYTHSSAPLPSYP